MPGLDPAMTYFEQLDCSAPLGRFSLGRHAERVEIGVEHRLLLAPLVLVLLADADHRAERLHVEAIALRLGIDLAQIGGERRLLLLEPLDAGDEWREAGLWLSSGAARGPLIFLTIDLPRSLGRAAVTGQRTGDLIQLIQSLAPDRRYGSRAFNGMQPVRAPPAASTIRTTTPTFRPFGLALSSEDQILPDLDQRMRQAAQRAVLIERIALELAGIGHVVADLDTGNGLATPRSSGSASRGSLSHSTPTCQGRGTLFQAWVKLCTETSTGGFPAEIAVSMAASIAWW